MAAHPAGTASSTSGRRRAARWGRRLLFVALAACWVLATWRALLPPIRIPLPDYEPDGIVFVRGGRIPFGENSSFSGDRVPDFWIDRFEVTQGAFAAFLAANPQESPPALWAGRTPERGHENRPVTGITLHGARGFAAWRGGRLPTVQEWEWAALGALGVEFPWGIDAASVRANTKRAGFGRTVDVGFFPDGVARSSGCYDMVGNVAEWTDTPVSAVPIPRLPPSRFDPRHYVRGGNYTDSLASIMDPHTKSEMESAEPLSDRLEMPGTFSTLIGFRCAFSAERIERERRLWDRTADLIQDLGTRDPVTTYLKARVASEKIRAQGRSALPLLRIAARRADDMGVKERLAALIDEIESS